MGILQLGDLMKRSIVHEKERAVHCVMRMLLLTLMIFGVEIGAKQGQANMLSVPASEIGLSELDVQRLSEAEKRWAVVTPGVQKAFLKVVKQLKASDRANAPVDKVRTELELGISVIDYQTMKEALDILLESDPTNGDLERYRGYLRAGDAEINLTRAPSALTRQLDCPPSTPCPTMPPICPTATLICNLDVQCIEICTALIEDLWVSGCIHFRDCGELIFTAAQFANVFDTSCLASGVAQPQLFVVSQRVFSEDIYQGDNCESQLIAREVLPSATQQTPVTFVDFAIPVDLDVFDPNPIEVDIHFLVPIDNSAMGNIQFEVCYEFKENGNVPYIVTPLLTELSDELAVTNFGGPASFNHYKVTACLNDKTGLAGCGLGRLMLRRVLPLVAEFNLPVYVVSMVFRYPRIPCQLPINCVIL